MSSGWTALCMAVECRSEQTAIVACLLDAEADTSISDYKSKQVSVIKRRQKQRTELTGTAASQFPKKTFFKICVHRFTAPSHVIQDAITPGVQERAHRYREHTTQDECESQRA